MKNNPDESRYDALVDGELAGFATYELAPDRVVFVHTEIEAGYEGQGVGSVLAGAALDDVGAQHKRVVPLCPFIAAYIRRHDQYADLLDPSYRTFPLP